MIRRLTIILSLLQPTCAIAHDAWANGSAIPAWVKSSCCGPADAHHLRPDQVHRPSDDYYEVDGYSRRIPAGSALPSQDGDYWIFYADKGQTCTPGYDTNNNATQYCSNRPDQSNVYCFFVPMEF